MQVWFTNFIFFMIPFYNLTGVPGEVWVQDEYYKKVWTQTYSRIELYALSGFAVALMWFSIFLGRTRLRAFDKKTRYLNKRSLGIESVDRFNNLTRMRKELKGKIEDEDPSYNSINTEGISNELLLN